MGVFEVEPLSFKGPDGSYTGGVIEANDAMLRMIGRERGEVLGRNEPRKALGVDIGDCAVVRYMESLTIIGMKERLLRSLKEQ